MHRSVALASLARVLPPQATAERHASCPLLKAAPSVNSPPPLSLPPSLTLGQVGHIQAKLARELVTLGTELLGMLQARFGALQRRLQSGGVPNADAVCAAVADARRIAHAQTAMLHNMGRWTAVASGDEPCAAARGAGHGSPVGMRQKAASTGGGHAALPPPLEARHAASLAELQLQRGVAALLATLSAITVRSLLPAAHEHTITLYTTYNIDSCAHT